MTKFAMVVILIILFTGFVGGLYNYSALLILLFLLFGQGPAEFCAVEVFWIDL